MARKRPPKPGPDHLLAPDQFPDLNRSFYGTRPWEYFRHRQRSLFFAAGAPEQLLAIGRAGVKVGRLSFTLADDDDGGVQEEQNRKRYVLAESEVLMHHASETVLRLYLAHEGLGGCPWLEIARTRSPGEFKKSVESRFLCEVQDTHRSNVGQVFFGADDPGKITPTPDAEQWTRGISNIEEFLRHFARHFLDADVYNALKHGLAVQAGESKVQIDGGDLLRAEGTALEFLSLRKNASGQSRWNLTTKWLEVDMAMSFVYVATMLMESMWSIARARYLGELPDSIRSWVTPAYDSVASRLAGDQASGVFIDTMHMELLYYAARKPAP